MGPDDHEKDLSRPPARRRRLVAGVLAGAAIAIPGIALAAGGGGGSSGSLDPAPAQDDAPAFRLQDEGSRREGRRHDGRRCRKHRDGQTSNPTSAERQL